MPKPPKPINDTTIEVTLSGGDKVEIGDKESVDFKPHIKLNRWDGECFIKVQMAGDIEGEVEYEVEGDKVKTKYKIKYGDFEQEVETEFYPLEPTEQYELGGFEFDVVLLEKPATNTIVLNIESQELKFNFQPALTQEEINEGCIRPDNVVGSYAVYHATKKNHILGQTNYMSGKAFHIYRPRIEDADGEWVWGELNYDEQAGTLTTTTPQDFLDAAVYPIRHLAGVTFGFSGTPGTFIGIQDWVASSIYTGVVGTVTHISVYCNIRDASYRGVEGGIYEDSDTLLKGTTVTGEAPVSGNWVTMAIDGTNPTVTVQGYWLAGRTDDSYQFYDNGATPYRYLNIDWANPWPANNTGFSTSGFSRDFGVYATYTPGGGPTAQAVGDGAIAVGGTIGLLTKITMGAGSISIAGVLGLLTKVAVGVGSISISGALSAALTYFQNVGSGAIAIASTLGRKIALSVGGSIAIAGTLGRVIKLAVGSGAIAIAGIIGRLIKLGVGAGTATTAGSLALKTILSVGAGSIAIAGALSASLAGIFQQVVGAGSVVINGTLGRKISLSVGAGAVTIVGALQAGLIQILYIIGTFSSALSIGHYFSKGAIPALISDISSSIKSALSIGSYFSSKTAASVLSSEIHSDLDIWSSITPNLNIKSVIVEH